MVTTENIPGDNRTVTGRAMVWAGGSSMTEVIENMQKWAVENNYDSIVGVRFTAVAFRSQAAFFSRFKHFGYGTCLRH
jgi:hypothetical protein